MHRLIPALLLLLLLPACLAQPARLTGFRAAGPIYSNAVLDPTTIDGRWQQVAAFATPGAPACAPGGADIRRAATGLTVALRLCLNGEVLSWSGPLAVTGPGRLTPATRAPRPLDREWWLLWVDGDLRTMVIGTPDGSFGFVLNRRGPIPADRQSAAREIFDWNGYDTGRLVAYW